MRRFKGFRGVGGGGGYQGYKRHFPQELAILSKSAIQYVNQSLEKNAFKN